MFWANFVGGIRVPNVKLEVTFLVFGEVYFFSLETKLHIKSTVSGISFKYTKRFLKKILLLNLWTLESLTLTWKFEKWKLIIYNKET